MKPDMTMFDGHGIRRVYDEELEAWWFLVVDMIQVAHPDHIPQILHDSGKLI